MNDTIQKISVGIVLAVFSGLFGALIYAQHEPNVQLLIESPMDLGSERVVVFRFRNFGGGVATGAEVRLSPKLQPSDVVLISKAPAAVCAGAPVVVSADRLKPQDGVAFYVREPHGGTTPPRDFVVSAVYDQGGVVITTLEERISSFVWMKQVEAFVVGLSAGAAVFGIILISMHVVEKRAAKKSAALVQQPAQAAENPKS